MGHFSEQSTASTIWRPFCRVRLKTLELLSVAKLTDLRTAGRHLKFHDNQISTQIPQEQSADQGNRDDLGMKVRFRVFVVGRIVLTETATGSDARRSVAYGERNMMKLERTWTQNTSGRTRLSHRTRAANRRHSREHRRIHILWKTI